MLFLTQESYKWPDVYFSLWIYHYLDLNEKKINEIILCPSIESPHPHWYVHGLLNSEYLYWSHYFSILKSISSFNFFNSNDKFIKYILEFIIYYCNCFSFIIVNIYHCVLWFLPLKFLEFETYYLFFIATILAYIFIICQFCLVDFHLLCMCSPHKLIQRFYYLYSQNSENICVFNIYTLFSLAHLTFKE